MRKLITNLILEAGENPSSFRVKVMPSKDSASISGDGCEFRGIGSDHMMVTASIGGQSFVVKLSSRSCDPRALNQKLCEKLKTSNGNFVFQGDHIFDAPKVTASTKSTTTKPTPATSAMALKTNYNPDEKPMSETNLKAAHVAIYGSVGRDKENLFTRGEAEEWLNEAGFGITHPVVTGRILSKLVERGLYEKLGRASEWRMTEIGSKVGKGDEPFPDEPETPEEGEEESTPSKEVPKEMPEDILAVARDLHRLAQIEAEIAKLEKEAQEISRRQFTGLKYLMKLRSLPDPESSEGE